MHPRLQAERFPNDSSLAANDATTRHVCQECGFADEPA
jgi:hypothetical protein